MGQQLCRVHCQISKSRIMGPHCCYRSNSRNGPWLVQSRRHTSVSVSVRLALVLLHRSWNGTNFSVGSASHLPYGLGSRHQPGQEYVHCTEFPLLGTAEGDLHLRGSTRQCCAQLLYGSGAVG